MTVEVWRAGTAQERLRALDAGARAGLLKGGRYLVDRTIRIFQIYAPRGHATGALIRSHGVSPVLFEPSSKTYRVRVGPGRKYGWWVHQGTGPLAGKGPRKQPPLAAILGWVKEKGLVPRMTTVATGRVRFKRRRPRRVIERDQRALAFLIARKIGRLGTAPFPTLRTAFKLTRADIERIVVTEVLAALTRRRA